MSIELLSSTIVTSCSYYFHSTQAISVFIDTETLGTRRLTVCGNSEQTLNIILECTNKSLLQIKNYIESVGLVFLAHLTV